jgi:hypothetical protein
VPTTASLNTKKHQCGGYCGDGVLSGAEKCEVGKTTIAQSCTQLGQGSYGKVGCALNSCGHYTGGCSNGILQDGDVRVALSWRKKSWFNTNVDLDATLVVPYNKWVIAAHGGNGPGSIHKDAYAWVSHTDQSASQGEDINNDGQPDGLEILTFKQIPGTNKYHNGTYRYVVKSFDGDLCFKNECTDISVTVSRKNPKSGILEVKTFKFPTSDLKTGTPQQFWHVFDMDANGVISEITTNKLMNTLPAHK